MGVNTSNNIVILGGGIFGITASLVLSELGYNITVIEEKNDILLGATLVNQNRIHYGYHYPRSSNTIKESLIGLESFLNFYGNSVNYNFKKYYAI
jgi:L-2-hydroxyglutarate oxidase LhgO